MSSDNGLYVLQTNKGNGHEFRVAYHMAVENYMWDDAKNKESEDPQVQIQNARKMWKDCEVFTDQNEALKEAHRQGQEFEKSGGWLEYGICFIEIDAEF